jgi:hypothetical protein
MRLIPEETVGHQKPGGDGDALFFPSVSSCMTITIVCEDGTLIGSHLTIHTTPDKIDAIVKHMAERATQEGRGGATQVVFAGVNGESWDGKITFDELKNKVLRATNERAHTSTFDTAKVASDTHVRIAKKGNALRLKIDPMREFKNRTNEERNALNKAGIMDEAERARRIPMNPEHKADVAQFVKRTGGVIGTTPMQDESVYERVHHTALRARLTSWLNRKHKTVRNSR